MSREEARQARVQQVRETPGQREKAEAKENAGCSRKAIAHMEQSAYSDMQQQRSKELLRRRRLCHLLSTIL